MIKLNNNFGTPYRKEHALRKKEVVSALHCYSDLSIKIIAQQAGLSSDEVRGMTDELAKTEISQAFVEMGVTKIEKIMSRNVSSLDFSKLAPDAAYLKSEKKVGSVIVSKNGRPLGKVTERDLIRRYFRDTLLENMASHPLITSRSRKINWVLSILGRALDGI